VQAAASKGGWRQVAPGWYQTPSGNYVEMNAKSGAKIHDHGPANAGVLGMNAEEEGGGGFDGAQESTAQILRQYLDYNPKFAEQMYQLTARYQPQYAAIFRDLTSRERTANLDDVQRLAPRLQGIRDAGDRADVRTMRDRLYASVLGELEMGEALTPEQERAAVQGVRSAQAARGLGRGQSDANLEAVQRALSGRALGDRRKAAASAVLATEAAQSPNPFDIILGNPPSNAANVAANQSNSGNQALTPSALAQTFFSSVNANQMAKQYNLALEIAKMNPYLYGGS
jgi:hypothetical protein